MHVSIVPVPKVGTFVYMYELKLVLQLTYCRVFPTDDVTETSPMTSLGDSLSNSNKLWYWYQYMLISLLILLLFWNIFSHTCINCFLSVGQLNFIHFKTILVIPYMNVTVDEVVKLTMRAPTKSCESNPIPTSLLKQIIHEMWSHVADIIIIPITSGYFPSSMKDALARPLPKKATLDLIKKTFHPVSNLNFHSEWLSM